jgi:HAMP domain-containing protein
MNLIVKVNLALCGAVIVGLAVTAAIAHKLLFDKARAEALENASIMMEAAMATRSYTSNRIKTLLDNQMKYVFLPESVPSYAATEIFSALRSAHPEYNYREAALNPTNVRDRAADWEADLVSKFRSDATTTEIVGERETPAGTSLYLARPITVKSEACLQCHSTPDAAPKPMVEKYGTANGFGWQMNETVGAQIVSVPSHVHAERAQATFQALMLSVAAVFVVVSIVLNVILTLLVIRPMARLASIAEKTSLGSEEAPPFDVRGRDEIAALARAFARMRTSLQKAMAMIDA